MSLFDRASYSSIQEEILPTDDLRHCPDWLRISDMVVKHTSRSINNNGRMGKCVPPKRIYILYFGEKLNQESMTIRQVSDKYGFPINTISSRLASGGQMRNGYSFELAGVDCDD